MNSVQYHIDKVYDNAVVFAITLDFVYLNTI